MRFDQWYRECERLAGDDWAFFQRWYSFMQDYEDWLSPEESIAECKAWMIKEVIGRE